ncbi:MAG: exo-beta-N-acetylmuramidase NamZ family protein [Bradymonadia bacterium]|jgi:uncharacterized protein YbbC (DUF1343 family)
MARVRTGLDRLVADGLSALKGLRVGLVCHPASVDAHLVHLTERCRQAGVNVVRCFGPEHGIWADAQDMISVDDTSAVEPVTGAPVRSLYGADEASLAPRQVDLVDLDVLVIDLQDIGSRYYTYIYTAALCVRAAARVGLRCLVLDRPNPLGGHILEGGMTHPDFTSFVGLWPLPVRHGLTLGEVCTLLNEREGFGARLEVVEVEGWRRSMWFDETGLPWVQPSPNMPTLDTAVVYPGMCLVEGTNLSEGRGATRPFETVGADFIQPFELARALDERGLPGVVCRPLYFRPTFHKFGGRTIGGLGVHVTDRERFQPLRLTLHLLWTLRRLYGPALEWRTEVYEFVGDRLAIDLLFGDLRGRTCIDDGSDPDALYAAWQAEARAFDAERAPFLRYT